jgi:hypothetical protein
VVAVIDVVEEVGWWQGLVVLCMADCVATYSGLDRFNVRSDLVERVCAC